MMSPTKFTLTTLLSLGACAGTLPQAAAADGFTDTPFVLNLDGTPMQWRTHDPRRPKPKKVEGTLQNTPRPAEAEVLFDGRKASAWAPCARNKKYGPPTLWPVKDGVLVASYQDLQTKKSYGDCKLHIEWRVPKNRSGQGQRGANSGVMFGAGRYEVQVLESHTNVTYADGQAAAIYGFMPPLVNPALPPGEWQSYDITYTAPRFDEDGNTLKRARFHVVFNGVVVQNDQELIGDGSYRGSSLFPTKQLRENPKSRYGHRLLEKHPARLPIRLQFHGDPIEFRNIWVIDLEKDAK
ncbi:MAG: DUF1080 domain-containing protein [Puniceicoccales bacterium]|jgi:hypothetical protein|nr:DUF1080 domain-containing protein [Puniceicoccales bacterium]